MGRADEKKQNKRNALMQAAFELFNENGREHTSISEIASRAGVAKGTFYLYFKDKTDINSHIIAYKSYVIFSGALSAMKNASDCSTPEDKMLFLVNYIIDILSADRSLMKFISKNLSWAMFRDSLSGESGKEIAECRREFAAITEGRVENPDIMIFLILEMINGSCCGPIIDNSPAPIEEMKPYIIRAVKGIVSEFIIKEER